MHERFGTVSTAVVQLLARQVEEHGIVVWYDPERHYVDLAAELDLPGATVGRYEGSFFQLRRTIEPLLNGEERPRLLVYVPLDPTETQDALVELEAVGVTAAPGVQPWQRNTRLSVIAQRALKDALGEDGAAAAARQVEAGTLTLVELDRLAEQGQLVGTGTVSLIFGSTSAADVALALVASDEHDGAIASKDAVGDVAALLGSTYEVDLSKATTPQQLRERLVGHVLTTDFTASAPAGSVEILGTIDKPAGREAARKLARTWRLRRDLQERYVAEAARVERSLPIATLEFSLAQLAGTETFLATEETLQEEVERALPQAPTAELVALATERQSSFWADARPEVQARWALIATAGRVLLEADRVAAALKQGAPSAHELLYRYTSGEQAWCMLDTHHRHLERRVHAFDFDLRDRHTVLEQLVTRARQRYMEVASALAEQFVRAYQAGKFAIRGVPRQRETFAKAVAPALAEAKTAYVLVDALRYEMARELVESLPDDFGADIQPALGTLPTITEIGMAALLPRAEAGVVLVQVGPSKLALEVDGAVLAVRKDRVDYLVARAGAAVCDAKLEDLLPLKRAVRQAIEGADLVLVTSQEIDALCEGDNVPLARRTMDDVLWQLRRAFHVLAELGVRTIVVTADHGYVFGEELESDMKIDAPGGNTVDLHRRVWVGAGGAASASYLRATATNFGLGGDFEIAVPWNFACFKVQGGASAYFHGGLSPQEVIVPVAVLKPQGQKFARPTIAWQLALGSKRISTRFFSVTVGGDGQLSGLFGTALPRVRVELRAGGKALSRPVSASYGFDEATGDVELRAKEGAEREIEPNTVALMIEGDLTQGKATVHLLDAGSGSELAKSGPFDVAISM